MEESTDDLIGKWVGGDRRAAEALYQRYFGRVREFAHRLGSSLNDAEEIAQEAVLAGLEGVKTGRRPDRFTHWLLGIARHLAARRTRTEREGFVDAVDPRSRGARTLVVRREMNDLLERTLEDLPPGCREVLDLLHRDQLTRKEAADRLGVPLEAIHARAERAYGKLREALSRHFTTLVLGPAALRAISLTEVRALRPAFRDAVFARHLEDLPESAAAARLGIPAATLRARLECAYEMLKCEPTADFKPARLEYRRGRPQAK